MPNEIEKKIETNDKLKFAVSKLTDVFISDLANVNDMAGIEVTPASKRCAMNLVMNLCAEHGVANVQNLPKEQVITMIQFVMINGLDINAGQVFLDKRKNRDGSLQSCKATPQGSAYEIMVNRWGVDVKRLHQARVVHEGDELQLPQYEGLKVTPLIHKPTLKGMDGKAIAIYYIVEKKDGSLDYLISTRENVAKNLMAQILNAALKDRETVDRNALMAQMEGKTLDELLTDPGLRQYISPAYRSPSSREQMIITKMKKNALLHYTRDLGGETNMDKATRQAIYDAENSNSDMVVEKNVVASVDGDEAEKPTNALPKVQDFDVDEPAAETLHEKEETPAEPKPIAENAPKAEIPQNPVETPKEPIREPEHTQTSIFDLEDL